MNPTILAAVLLAVLLAAPLAGHVATAAEPKPAPAPGFEATLSESAVGALLSAVMPYDAVLEQEVGALGFTRTVQVSVRLATPRTRITPEGVKVTLDYALTDASGLLNRSGTAVPTLTLTPVPARARIEGRLTRSGIFLPGGVELPLEALVEPIEIPAVIPQEIEAGDKTIAAEARVTEVLLEEGRIRVRGEVSVRPALAKPAVAPSGK